MLSLKAVFSLYVNVGSTEKSNYHLLIFYYFEIDVLPYAPINVLPAGGGGEVGHRVGI